MAIEVPVRIDGRASSGAETRRPAQFLGDPGTYGRSVTLRASRGKLSRAKILAVIHADGLHGLRGMLEVCPVDCIWRAPGEEYASLQTWCDVDLDRRIGCKHCAQVCSWDAIDMVETLDVAQHVAHKVAPPEYVDRHFDDLVDAAQRNAEGLLAKKK